jgi:hypothetical protein
MKSVIHSAHYAALAVSSVIFVASICAYLFIYYQVGVQSDQTVAAYQNIATARQAQSQSDSLVSGLSYTQTELATLQSFFVSNAQTVGFITRIENIGNRSGSTVSIVSISEDDLSSSPAGATGNIHAHLQIQGSWSSAMQAFHLIENMPYGESIDNVRVVPISDKKWSIEFDLTTLLIQ